ncbi:MAG: TlpA family protein disulfide reductase [Candidatus Bipolaricaulia bacterium]
MKRDVLVGILAVILTALLIVGGYYLFFKVGRSVATIGRATWIGDPAPPFELEEYRSGKMVSLTELQGQSVVINFWLGKCGTCIAELPALQAFYGKHKDEMAFYAINAGESWEEIDDFVKRYRVEYPILLDPRGKVFTRYGATGVPETVFIDSKGIIRWWIIGQASERDLEEGLEKIIVGG